MLLVLRDSGVSADRSSCRMRRFARWRRSAKTTRTTCLSITTLKPRQIISGKLGSSIVQMAVYFSAITPCLAFTYLLRGVDRADDRACCLCYTFFWSLGLSMVGILLATLTHAAVCASVYSRSRLSALLLLMFGWAYRAWLPK